MRGIETYTALSRPPATALKPIQGGRLNGKSDINPQWRIKAMTEQFGLCGIGWKMTIDKVWNEPAPDGQVFAWAQVSLFIKDGDTWSEPVPGLGGNYLVEKEKAGLHANDEGYKMAITDAFGTAAKLLGVAADVYAGAWDGTKYKDTKPQEPSAPLSPQNPIGKAPEDGMRQGCVDIVKALGLDKATAGAILTAHGGKKTNEGWAGVDWAGVLAELTERQRAFNSGADAAFNGAA